MSVRAVAAMLLAFAVPGAGHLFLGRHRRAAAFFLIVATMFVVGVAIGGGLYTVGMSRGAALKLLSSYGSMGSGLLYAAAYALGVRGDIASSTFEYGITFTLTAGLMNLLLVLDCFDIANGRKA
jgi:hypothetical protein